MYHYIVHDTSKSQKKFLKSVFRFLHLLIRGLINQLSPDQAIFYTFSTEMHYYIVHSDSTQ